MLLLMLEFLSLPHQTFNTNQFYQKSTILTPPNNPRPDSPSPPSPSPPKPPTYPSTQLTHQHAV
ncbi:hypothetical protein M758_4G196300 [Ceratodon purpureus]|nr:hypothetical protein M758_4G196300 [Ceratodon purpureus]